MYLLDAFFHSCLCGQNGNTPRTPEAKREFAKNFEVGDVYFYEKNNGAVESRRALEYKPDQPETTYELAVSVEKLGKTDDALELYQSYLTSHT